MNLGVKAWVWVLLPRSQVSLGNAYQEQEAPASSLITNQEKLQSTHLTQHNSWHLNTANVQLAQHTLA